jgi:hypothetical protein
MRLWKKKKVADVADEITDDLKKVTVVAGDHIAPGMGTLLLVLGAAAAAGAGAYYVSRKRNAAKAKKP